MTTSAMEARYKTLKLVDLKAIAKNRGIRRVTNRRKADLIAEMVALDARETADVAAAEQLLKTGKAAKRATIKAETDTENVSRTAELSQNPETKTVDKGERKAENTAEAEKPVRRRGRPRKKRAEDPIPVQKTVLDERTGTREKNTPDRDSEEMPEGKRTKRKAPVRKSENQPLEEARKFQHRPKSHLDLGVEEESADETGHGGYSRFYRRRNELTYDRGRRFDPESADSHGGFEYGGGPRTDRQEIDRESARRSYNEFGHNYRSHREEISDAVSPQLAEQMSDASEANGILEIMPDGYGFLHTDNFLTGEDDAYVAPSQIRRFAMKTGDRVEGLKKRNNPTDKFAALLRINSINGRNPEELRGRQAFENLTPIFPRERLRLERKGSSVASRVIDLIAPIGKGQRGLIVSPPKAGKTTLLKEVAKSVQENHPEMHMMILLIDERPEEVTDMKETIVGDNVEIIYSTFDQMPDHHTKVSEMVIERAKRLVEQGEDVIILLDSITRLARAYNLTVTSSGRILSGGLDPAALYMPKRFFGAARNMREGGSLTVLATALVDTGSRMDDVVYEEFKGTGNMELILDRRLSERRIFPAVDIVASGTRREDLLLNADEMEAARIMHRGINGRRAEENTEDLLNMFAHTKDNKDFIRQLLRHPIF